jgi:polyhydroxyalkanoate synthesis regulator phasin
MVKKVKDVEEAAEKETAPLVEAVRKVLLAGIGAVALAQDEAEDFVNKLVERGEIAEKDARKIVRELVDKRKKATKKSAEELDKRVEEMLDRMSVPSKADIQALSDKIAALAQKVDELKK